MKTIYHFSRRLICYAEIIGHLLAAGIFFVGAMYLVLQAGTA